MINVNTTVDTAANSGHGLVPFNPFTTKPIECPQGAGAGDCANMGANWQLGPDFGKPQTATTATTAGDFQTPRTFLVSLGVRF